MRRSIIDSFNYAVSGIILSIKSEKNMKIHYIIALAVLGLSLLFDFTRLEFLILLFAISLVLTLEMINTAVERTVDMITKDYHPNARIAKDISAGAVLIAATNSLIVGYLLFFDRLSQFSAVVLVKIKKSPIHLTFIALLLVVLLTIGIKARYYKGRGTHFQGGTISGHSAVAFCVATIITFLVENILVVTLAFGLALLVAESRVEGKIHTAMEVILGSALGIIVAILAFQIIG